MKSELKPNRSSRIRSAFVAIGPIAVVVLQALPSIPAWKRGQSISGVAILVTYVVAGIWQLSLRERPPLFRRKIVLAPLLVIGAALMVFSLFASLFNGTEPDRMIQTPGGPMLYLFEHACWPPDGRSECGDYSSEIKARIWITPFTRKLYGCACFFGEPSITDGIAEIPLEENKSTHAKVIRIQLRSGELL